MISVERLREMGGCTRLCSLSSDDGLTEPRINLIHNGVSFSHRSVVDVSIIEAGGQYLLETLAAWLQAHHRGDQATPFRHWMIGPMGQRACVEVPEYVEEGG